MDAAALDTSINSKHKKQSRRSRSNPRKGKPTNGLARGDKKDQARAAEKKNAAARRQALLLGLSVEDKREMTSFMGSVDAKTRNSLQEVVAQIVSSGRDPRLLIKKVLVHALANLDIDRCASFLETMQRLGSGATFELLWLYERYNVPNAGGGMSKCTADHFGRDMGTGKMKEILDMVGDDKLCLVRQLDDWDPVKKVKVMRAWEAADPAMTVDFLLGLIREEQGREKGTGNLWQCSLCPIKRDVDIESKMKRGEHRRKDGTADAGALYGYLSEGKRGIDIYRSRHETLFEFVPQKTPSTGGRDSGKRAINSNSNSNSNIDFNRADNSSAPKITSGQDCEREEKDNFQSSLPRLTYARRGFDPRRICGSCTKELRGAIVSSGHDLELWHTVDHERRELLMEQRRSDVFKAKWAEKERGDRQISEVLRLICEANLEAFSRHSLKERARAVRDSQAAEIRRMLDLKMSDMEAVDRGASKDETLKRLNVREATLWAGTLRLKASLNMDRHYASPDLGGIPASLRRRHATSTQPSDFLDDGTPATPQGAMQTFGREDPPDMDESKDIRTWKEETKEAEEVLDRRREVREWQSSYGGRTRFSYLCGRWVGAASDIEEKQRQKRMLETAERERRLKEILEAKLKRKLQLANLRARAGSRATGESRRRVQRDQEEEERRRREGEELVRMRDEEAKQLAGGDRYWGLVREMQRLRAIEEERRLAWEARIRATREKMVAVRCISELSEFSHATPPRDPELEMKIHLLATM